MTEEDKRKDEDNAFILRWDLRPSEMAALRTLSAKNQLNAVVRNWHGSAEALKEGAQRFGGEVLQNCAHCGVYHWASVLQPTTDGQTCAPCIRGYYRTLHCGHVSRQHYNVVQDGTGLQRSWCAACVTERAVQCRVCAVYYATDLNHNHNCQCQPLYPEFQFPNDGHDPVANGERFVMDMPQGVIDPEGISAICRAIRSYYGWSVSSIKPIVESLDPTWQIKTGNFTKRLSAAFWKQYQVKLDPGLISEVGNLGAAHSGKEHAYYLDFSRQFDETAKFWYHADSCYWGSVSNARCCLKNWGAVGLRSFTDADTPAPNGRAWVLPLDERLAPTHDALNAHAFIVFNGYGALEGPKAARILAHLTGRSYKRLQIQAGDMYVNGGQGYLVADAATLEKRLSVEITGWGRHHNPVPQQVRA